MKRLLTLTLIMLFAVLAAGCVAEVVTSGDYTLRSGEILRGDLVVTSGDITLEEGSRVTGRVIMTSGVLDANGEVDGDVILTSGDVNLGPQAVVRGDVRGTSGHISRSEGAHVEGRVSTDGSDFSVGIGIFARIIGLYCVLPLVVIGALIYLFAGSRRRPAAAQVQMSAAAEDPSLKLKQLQEMLDSGLITEDDYAAKKAEILAN